MSKAYYLKNHGIRLFSCNLYNHDYLWFSSYEVSKVSSTIPLIHNYALSYSLADYSYGVYHGYTPRYEEDIAQFRLYATPALGEYYTKSRIIYNALNSKSLRTDDAPSGINSPGLGWRIYINPVYNSDKVQVPMGFRCYVFTFDGKVPKGVTRLGKKGTAIRVEWIEIKDPVAYYKEEAIRPTHPVNPLDISGEIYAYDPVMLPPHMIFRTVEIGRDWFIFADDHRIHVPAKVRTRMEGGRRI